MNSYRWSLPISAAWVFFIGSYATLALLIPRGLVQTTARDLLACTVPLFANTCLLWNSATPFRRYNAFWKLLALGCTLFLAGMLVLMSHELGQHPAGDAPLLAGILFFLHTVPLMAALALMPHLRKMGETLRYGLVDLTLLSILWLYIYIFTTMPWKVALPNDDLFRSREIATYVVENSVVVLGFAILFFRTKGNWRTVYGHIFGATSVYLAGVIYASRYVTPGQALSGSIVRLLILTSFVWLGTTGLLAHGLKLEPNALDPAAPRDTQWPTRCAMVGVIALPFLAAWTAFVSEAPLAVRNFRLLVTLVALILGASLVFVRQHLVYLERTSLVHELYDSLQNVKRLQTHFVQSEKLASLGQLAAGAAHEINNPLTAILGFAEVLTVENQPQSRPHALGEKIREQARRTKELVTNLLSFARQVPAEKQLLDLNTVLAGAVQLRTLDLRDRNIRIDLQSRSVLPAVRGDPNQLLQVFYHLISNAVDAMESTGGVLMIRALREKGTVVIEFSDTGPGLKEPEKVFDPFYTTKPVGKGTGLGLSICYGILQEHGGIITGFNRPEGGCTFRIELPAIFAPFPKSSPVQGVLQSR
jgi:signal transduction histidine kinase